MNDRGFLLGDGLFETMRVVRGKPFRLAQHLERLARGADFLKIKLPFAPKELEKFAGQLVEQNQMPEAILRLTLTRGPGGRGYTPNSESKPTLVMTLHPRPERRAPARQVAKMFSAKPGGADVPLGWNLITSSFRIHAADPLASFKTTSKVLHVMARAEAVEKGADEALLLNTNGEVAETAERQSVLGPRRQYLHRAGGRGILPGITRAVVLEICRMLGLPVDERVINPEEVEKIRRCFRHAKCVRHRAGGAVRRRAGAPSPLVDQIARAYREMLLRP